MNVDDVEIEYGASVDGEESLFQVYELLLAYDSLPAADFTYTVIAKQEE